MKAVVLSDGRPGHFHQSTALCQHLGLDYDICEIEIPSKIHRVFSHLFDRIGIHTTSLFRQKGEIPAADIVVSAGSRTYYPNKCIAKKFGAKSVAILAPRGYNWDFDALIVPDYDDPPEQDNVVTLPINLSYTKEDLITEKIHEFQKRFPSHTPTSHKVGILLGGDNKAGQMNPAEIASQLDSIQKNHPQSEVWVTTSRRTPQEVERDLKTRNFSYLHLYSDEPYNPIPAFIHLCDHLYVTTDSTSMLSECVSSGKAKVSLIQTACSPKHRAMVENLKQRNLIDTDQKIDISPYIQKVRKILNLYV